MMQIPTLKGRWVALEPIAEAHREPLRQAADDERIWATTIVRAAGDGFDAWFNALLAERAAGRWYPFAVRRMADCLIVGSTSYLDISPKHRRLEIGATWYRPDTWGSMVNPECKLLLLANAFEVQAGRLHHRRAQPPLASSHREAGSYPRRCTPLAHGLAGWPYARQRCLQHHRRGMAALAQDATGADCAKLNKAKDHPRDQVISSDASRS